jgi:hypothetical protein
MLRRKNPEFQELRERRTHRGARTERQVKLGYLGKLGPYPVYLVRGEAVRRMFDIDFTMGSHFAHSRFIPEPEIWVEDSLAPSDLYPLLVHEAVELDRMINRWTYERGHDLASRVEMGLRRQRKQILTRRGAMVEANRAFDAWARKPRTLVRTVASDGRRLRRVTRIRP